MSAPEPVRLIREFDRFVGRWSMVGSHPAFAAEARGTSTFEWLMDGALLIWRFEWEEPGPPSAVSVIGRDDASPTCSMLYSDRRGVGRVYQTTVDQGVWSMWRDAPGFSQRMRGTFSDDGNTITVRGELSRDGSRWDQDLSVTYTRQA
jgi:hypothetical protein